MLERIDDGGIFQRFYEALKSDKRFVVFGAANFVTALFDIKYKYEDYSIYMTDMSLECEDGVLYIGWHKGMKSYESTFDLNNYDIQNMKKILDDFLDSIPPVAEQKNKIEILNNEKSSSEEKLKALEDYTAERAFLAKFDKLSKNPALFLDFVEDAAALANLSLDEFYAAIFF